MVGVPGHMPDFCSVWLLDEFELVVPQAIRSPNANTAMMVLDVMGITFFRAPI